MPLYNNILQSRKSDTSKGSGEESSKSISSNASMKLLQDHLASKRRLHQQNTPAKVQKQADNKSIHDSKSSQIILESSLHKKSENDWEPDEEYDPMMPNSFEVLQAEYLKRAEEERIAAAARASRPSSIKFNPNILEVLDKLDEDNIDDLNDSRIRGTAIAPPPSLLSSNSSPPNVDTEASGKLTTNSRLPNNVLPSTDCSSVGVKIMSKMGYKVGQGLGKNEQGMSSPLEVEKSGVNLARILSRKEESQAVPNSNKAESKDDKMAELLRESTRVLLLQNMVGPGDVDDDLEAETKEECKKYGDVVKCLIYEIPNNRVPDSEAVRIFVEFRTVESAIKAASDLNGRYFGGRIVRASFYSVERFYKYELGP